jgi:hypothetical protein
VSPTTVNVTFTRVATLAGDVQPIFDSKCAGCHYSGAAGVEGVDLSGVEASYTSLVNAAFASGGYAFRVIPGDLANSGMYHQLIAETPDPMPPGCTTPGASRCLDPGLVNIIAAWIQQGARKSP